MFARVRKEIIGATVLFLRIGSHDVSFADNVDAERIVGRLEGQSTRPGA
jgi:hypothetical protein